MDAGTNTLDILTGRVYPLKLGFIGIVNHSQQDINSEKSMADALGSETEFFWDHPAYWNIAHKKRHKVPCKDPQPGLRMSYDSELGCWPLPSLLGPNKSHAW